MCKFHVIYPHRELREAPIGGSCRRRRLRGVCSYLHLQVASISTNPSPPRYARHLSPRRGSLLYIVFYFNLLYSSASTGSHHSLLVFSPGTSIARWANQLVGAAPCQCLTPAGMFTTSPGCSSRAGLPHSW